MNVDIDKIVLISGCYVKQPYFEDYGDGEGVQLTGGAMFSSDDKFIGHIGPVGPKGKCGPSGTSNKSDS